MLFGPGLTRFPESTAAISAIACSFGDLVALGMCGDAPLRFVMFTCDGAPSNRAMIKVAAVELVRYRNFVRIHSKCRGRAVSLSCKFFRYIIRIPLMSGHPPLEYKRSNKMYYSVVPSWATWFRARLYIFHCVGH